MLVRILFVFDDVAEVWRGVKNEKFDAYRKRASWVWKCLYWTVRLGDIFLSTIYATDPDGLYNLRVRQQGKDYYIPTAAEVEELFDTSIRVEHHLYPFLYLPSLAFPCYNGIIS